MADGKGRQQITTINLNRTDWAEFRTAVAALDANDPNTAAPTDAIDTSNANELRVAYVRKAAGVTAYTFVYWGELATVESGVWVPIPDDAGDQIERDSTTGAPLDDTIRLDGRYSQVWPQCTAITAGGSSVDVWGHVV